MQVGHGGDKTATCDDTDEWWADSDVSRLSQSGRVPPAGTAYLWSTEAASTRRFQHQDCSDSLTRMLVKFRSATVLLAHLRGKPAYALRHGRPFP